jgi:hypothetical protein
MSNGQSNGAPGFGQTNGTATSPTDATREAPGQSNGQSNGRNGTPEQRRTSPPLVGGVCRSDRWVLAVVVLR